MTKRILFAAAMGAMLAGAQPTALPDTYSFVAMGEMGGPMTIKVNRNGSKEVVESKTASGNLHLRQIYDFQAQKLYNLDLLNKTCTLQTYVSPYVPMNFDPIGASKEMAAASASMPVVRTESVNGIATSVMERAIPEGRGKITYWLEEKYRFPVKTALAVTGRPERTVFEIQQISYAPSPESVFTPPSECNAVGGVTSATGGRAEMKVEAKAAATHHLSGKASAAKVTAVRLRLEPPSYAGPCPSRVRLVGDITTDGPGTVWYEFLAGAVKKSGPGLGKVTFDAAGTQTVTLDAEYIRTPAVPNTSLIAVMADEQGRRGPQNVSSGPVKFNASCTAGRE